LSQSDFNDSYDSLRFSFECFIAQANKLEKNCVKRRPFNQVTFQETEICRVLGKMWAERTGIAHISVGWGEMCAKMGVFAHIWSEREEKCAKLGGFAH
jgi:hypothetical protein